MVEDIKEKSYPVRIKVKTGRNWRAEQLANTLLAIDRIAARVGIASYISETCEAYDHVIRHMGTFGLLGKGPESWEKPKSPTDLELRNDLAAFISAMRNVGVDVKVTHLGVSYSFLVEDLSELLPISCRAEIERISMSSPGDLDLSLNALKSEGAVRLLDKIYDSIFFRKQMKRERNAKVRQEEAKAEVDELAVDREKLAVDREKLAVHREECDLVLDIAVAVDSIVSALRNAGFDNSEIRKVVRDSLMADVDLLARHKSMGLIRDLTLQRLYEDSNANL